MNKKEQYEFDKENMRQAYEFAQNYSQDPDTWSGCKIYVNDFDSQFGTNRLPEGIEAEPWMFERPAKYNWLEHCERDAINRYPGNLTGSTIFINWFPCENCSRAMVNAGIKRVVLHKEGQESYERISGQNHGDKDWNQNVAFQILERAGVKVDVMSFSWDGQVRGRFRGEDVTL